jgi:hypothetical protein
MLSSFSVLIARCGEEKHYVEKQQRHVAFNELSFFHLPKEISVIWRVIAVKAIFIDLQGNQTKLESFF